MAKYIDAEKAKNLIEKKYEEFIKKSKMDCPLQYQYMADGLIIAKSFIDYLQEEESTEVDLEKEYNEWWESIKGKINVEHFMEWYMHETARQFYKLGINARKED